MSNPFPLLTLYGAGSSIQRGRPDGQRANLVAQKEKQIMLVSLQGGEDHASHNVIHADEQLHTTGRCMSFSRFPFHRFLGHSLLRSGGSQRRLMIDGGGS